MGAVSGAEKSRSTSIEQFNVVQVTISLDIGYRLSPTVQEDFN